MYARARGCASLRASARGRGRYLAAVAGLIAADADAADRAAIIDVAAEREVGNGVARIRVTLVGIALVLVAVGIAVWRRISARADQAGHSKAVVRPALDIGDRGHAHLRIGVVIAVVRIALIIAVALLTVGAVARTILRLGLGDGRGCAAGDRGAVADVVAIAEKLADDLFDRVARLGIILLRVGLRIAGISLLG